jgi:hypothetical protein
VSDALLFKDFKSSLKFMGEDEILEEAVQLSEAVLSEGRSYFEHGYSGELETYMIVEDIRNRIEMATLDSGEMVYPEDVPSLEELGGEEAARVLRDNPLEPGDYREVFEEKGLVEVQEEEVNYTREAFAYFLLFDEAERLVEEGFSQGAGGEVEEDPVSEPVVEEVPVEEEKACQAEVEDSGGSQGEAEAGIEDEETEESEDKVEELERIWKDVSSE